MDGEKEHKQRAYDITDGEICRDCDYFHIDAGICGYIITTGKSRIFTDRERQIERGKCNKYKKRRGKKWI